MQILTKKHMRAPRKIIKYLFYVYKNVLNIYLFLLNVI